MPNVKSRPRSWTGVDFGPLPCDVAAEFIWYGASYAARQISFPVATSRADTASCSPVLENRKTRPAATIGDECPSPAWTFQICLGRSGHAAGGVKPTAAPVRDGPRHCGQSWAEARAVQRTRHEIAATRRVRFAWIIVLKLFDVRQRQPQRCSRAKKLFTAERAEHAENK